MRCVLGIGNPGSRYSKNRHNAGFLLLDYFAAENSLLFNPAAGDYFSVSASAGSADYILVKPSKYVNNSGIAARQVIEKYDIDIRDFLVVVDDVNLPTGELRVKESGGDAGHNGVSSIIYQLENDRFPRIRIGIGAEFEKGRMVEYVLEDFTEEEISILKDTFQTGSALIKEFITGGVKSMLDYNSRRPGFNNSTQ